MCQDLSRVCVCSSIIHQQSLGHWQDRADTHAYGLSPNTEHSKQKLFILNMLFFIPSRLPPPFTPLILQDFSIVEGVSYRGLADNTDGQCVLRGGAISFYSVQ